MKSLAKKILIVHISALCGGLNSKIENALALWANSLFSNLWHKVHAFNIIIMPKTIVVLYLVACTGSIASAQATAPCKEWLTGFITTPPKLNNGEHIEAYITSILQCDTVLKSAANCMVGLRIYVNCKGEFSYDKIEYRNNVNLAAQCSNLLQTTERIMDGIKLLWPGTIDNVKKDFVFKLVVWVTRKGKAKTEILY